MCHDKFNSDKRLACSEMTAPVIISSGTKIIPLFHPLADRPPSMYAAQYTRGHCLVGRQHQR
jgi:hypothetical protein